MAESLAYEARPSCLCASQLFHDFDCPKAHPEVAALPKELPEGVTVSALRGQVSVQFSGDGLVDPAKARALARALLLKADEADRQELSDVA
jgi:hypothetical protein